MEETRTAARKLSNDGRVEILQKGSVIDPEGIRGPVRLRLKQEACKSPEDDGLPANLEEEGLMQTEDCRS